MLEWLIVPFFYGFIGIFGLIVLGLFYDLIYNLYKDIKNKRTKILALVGFAYIIGLSYMYYLKYGF
jgi:hypothetical protein